MAARRVIDGPQNYLGSLYRSVPVGITVEGANILTRNLIVFGQGAIRAHPYLLEEMMALGETDDAQGPRRLRQGVLETCRPQRHHAVPRLGPQLDRRPVRAGAGRRRRDRILSPALALFVGLRAVRRHGAADPGRRAQAQGNALGAVRRYPVRTLSVVRPRLKRWEDEGRQEADFAALEWCMASGFTHHRERALPRSSPTCRTASWPSS